VSFPAIADSLLPWRSDIGVDDGDREREGERERERERASGLRKARIEERC